VLAVSHWIELSGVQPQLVWEPPRSPTIEFAEQPIANTVSLFGALGLQLLYAAAAKSGFALCSGCGKAYFPTRRPARGRERFCSDRLCRETAAWRLSKQRAAAGRTAGKKQRRRH
jgi:hypothetical protein